MASFKPDIINQHTLLDVYFLEIIGTDTFEYGLYRLLARKQILSSVEAGKCSCLSRCKDEAVLIAATS